MPTEFRSERRHGYIALSVSLTHGADNSPCQLGVMVIFAGLDLFLDAGVPHIVRVSAEEQMIGINTQGVIATGAIVANLHAIGNRTEVNLPRDAVGKQRFLWRPVVDVTVFRSGPIRASNPEPAGWRLVDHRPKSFRKRFGAALVIARLATEDATASADFAEKRQKLLSAGGADSLNTLLLDKIVFRHGRPLGRLVVFRAAGYFQ